MALAYPKFDVSIPATSMFGTLKTVSGGDLVSQRFQRLLFTSPGDIIHRPNLGGDLKRFENIPPTDSNLTKVKNSIINLCKSMVTVDGYEIDVKRSEGSGFEINVKLLVNGDTIIIPEVTIV